MASPQTEEFFDLIASSQSRRLDDQRANVGNLPGLRITHNNLGHLRVEGDAQEPGDEFFNMLMKCQVLQGRRAGEGGPWFLPNLPMPPPDPSCPAGRGCAQQLLPQALGTPAGAVFASISSFNPVLRARCRHYSANESS